MTMFLIFVHWRTLTSRKSTIRLFNEIYCTCNLLYNCLLEYFEVYSSLLQLYQNTFHSFYRCIFLGCVFFNSFVCFFKIDLISNFFFFRFKCLKVWKFHRYYICRLLYSTPNHSLTKMNLTWLSNFLWLRSHNNLNDNNNIQGVHELVFSQKRNEREKKTVLSFMSNVMTYEICLCYVFRHKTDLQLFNWYAMLFLFFTSYWMLVSRRSTHPALVIIMNNIVINTDWFY